MRIGFAAFFACVTFSILKPSCLNLLAGIELDWCGILGERRWCCEDESEGTQERDEAKQSHFGVMTSVNRC